MYRIWRTYTDGRPAEPTTVTRKTLRAARSYAVSFNASLVQEPCVAVLAGCLVSVPADPYRLEVQEEA